MKRLIISCAIVLCGLVTVSAMTEGQTVIKVKSKGSPTKIGVPKVTSETLYHDVVDDEGYIFGGEGPNWGGEYVEIARFDGKVVKMGYDYHSLNHCVLIGDDVVLNDIALLCEDRDSISNTVTFGRGLKKETINFNNGDALAKLKALCAVPDGWKREDLVYCYTDEKHFVNTVRYEIAADIPSDAGLRKVVLKLLDECLNPVYDWRDTVYVIDKKINSFYDVVDKKAEGDYRPQYFLIPASPESLYPPTEGSKDAISFDYIWQSPEYLTVMMTDNATYPAGGCRSSQQIYYTIDKKSGRILKEKDLVEADKQSDFIDAVKNAIYEDLVSQEGEDWLSMEEINDAISEYYDKEEGFHVAIAGDRLVVGYPGEMLTNFGEDGNWNVVLPLSALKDIIEIP